MTAFEITALVAALVLSTVFLVTVVAAVWWFDRYDREPLHMVGGVFLWGALAAPVFSVAGCSVVGIGFQIGQWALAGWVGPFMEELAKAVGIILVVVLSREFDNPTDGVVYGTAAGLGFAVTENLCYTVAGAGGPAIRETLLVVLTRTALAAGIHAVSSAAFGGCLGFAYLSKDRWRRIGWTLLGLAGAVMIHAGWNAMLLTISPTGDADRARWFAAVPALYAIYLLSLVIFLKSEQRILTRELTEEVELGLVPPWVADVIPYYRRRIRGDWWPSHRERTVLARLLTRLAFRKHAVRRLPVEEAEIAGLEVVQLRQRVRAMLGEVERGDRDGESSFSFECQS